MNKWIVSVGVRFEVVQHEGSESSGNRRETNGFMILRPLLGLYRFDEKLVPNIIFSFNCVYNIYYKIGNNLFSTIILKPII